jgi:hypothetical protein
MQLIGLNGPAGSGKDTIAEYLRDHHGFATLSFAHPVYAGVSAAFGIPIEQMKDRHFKEQPIWWIGKSPRQLLQLFGTEFGREMVAKDIWLRVAKNTLDEVCYLRDKDSAPCRVVISDVRFDNEAEWVRNLGGVIWHIHRPGVQPVAAHVSEAGVSFETGDEQVVNDEIAETHRQVDSLLSLSARQVA